jgi:hypothetical protein
LGGMADRRDAQTLKVFISYSHRDCNDLAEELVSGLDLIGFDAFLDRHDIAAAEDWELRLANLIQSSDTVVFVVSPEAVKSDRCAWEVKKAVALSKRLIPVIGREVPNGDVPADLRRLNYIFFAEGYSFTRSLRQVADALRTDLDWIREHTRLGELSLRWQQRDQLDALLLRDDELGAAQAWLVARKPGGPDVSDLQRAFIAASAEAETQRANKERQQLEEIAKAQAARAEALADRERVVTTLARRTLIGGIGAATFSVAAAGLAYWAWSADAAFRREHVRAEEAQARSFEAATRREAMRTDIEGQLIAYAAGPHQLASDGNAGGNSPYTSSVLAQLADVSTSLQTALSRSNKEVLVRTNGTQRPYISSDMNGDIYLKQSPTSRRCRAIVASVDSAGSVRFANVKRDALSWAAFLKPEFDVRPLANPARHVVLDAIQAASFAQVTSTPVPRGVQFDRPGPGNQQKGVENTCLLLFFSGGGFQANGSQFLIAADTVVDRGTRMTATAIDVAQVARLMRDASAASFIVLDTAFPDYR